jgi:hypothetical protein
VEKRAGEVVADGKEVMMNSLSALEIAAAVSLALSTVISVVMTKPLRAILGHLCPRPDATGFWVSFTIVMLYVTPLMFTMLFEATVSVPELVNIVRTALAAGLFGAFAALLVVGYQIARARPVAR